MAVPVITSVSAVPAYASAASGAPVVLDDFTAFQNSPGTAVMGSMVGGERTVVFTPGSTFEVSGGMVTANPGPALPGVLLGYSGLDATNPLDLSGCTTIRVAATPGTNADLALKSAGSVLTVSLAEAGGFLTFALADFINQGLDESAIEDIQLRIRSAGTLTGPFEAV